MSDQKDIESSDNWAKNAEEHGRMGRQIELLTVQVDLLTRTAYKLEKGQKDLRVELIVRTDKTERRTDPLEGRIDKIGDELVDGKNETDTRNDKLSEELIGLFEEENKRNEIRFAQLTDKFEAYSKEIRNELRWFMGIGLAFAGLLFIINRYFPVG